MNARPSLAFLSPGVWEKYEGRGLFQQIADIPREEFF
jgi:hypothetical protein